MKRKKSVRGWISVWSGTREFCWMAVALGMMLTGCAPPPRTSSVRRIDTRPPSFGDAALTVVGPASGIEFIQSNGARGDHRFLETTGSGVCVFDYDGDGLQDLYFVQNGTLPLGDESRDVPAGDGLYRNLGELRFTDVTSASGLGERPGYGQGATAADVDGDGDPDLLVTGYRCLTLYRNDAGRFQDVTKAFGLSGAPRWNTSAAFGDYDSDGFPDLYVCGYMEYDVSKDPRCEISPGIYSHCPPTRFKGAGGRLFRNVGGRRFRDTTREAGLHRPEAKNLACCWGDVDRDGRSDLFVACDTTPNLLFHNLGDGRFKEIAVPAGVASGSLGEAMSAMSADFLDVDGDGDVDLFATDFTGRPHALWLQESPLQFAERGTETGVGPPGVPFMSFGSAFPDLDLDGWRDLYVANGHIQDVKSSSQRGFGQEQPAQVFRNLGSGRFQEVGGSLGPAVTRPRIGRGVAVADLDNDGDPDLVQSNMNGAPDILRNDRRTTHHWIRIRCLGSSGEFPLLGTQVRVVAGGRTQVGEFRSASGYLSQSDSRLLFGLGTASRVDRLEVRWPDGGASRLDGQAVDREIVVRVPARSAQAALLR